MNNSEHLPKRVALGSDHVGYELKEAIKAYLTALGVECPDFGTDSKDRTDYPRFAEQVAQSVVSGKAERGILICGTGVGMSIAANKLPGIRAVVCSEAYSAVLSREHNDTNVLALGARVVGPGLARTIVEAWLRASYEGGRHARRLEMIAELETKRAESKEQKP
jgi:ribose 5-phosphate isomerase B